MSKGTAAGRLSTAGINDYRRYLGSTAYRAADRGMRETLVQHQPVRPGWTCTGDGEPWPCPVARVRLRCDYAGDPTRLAVYMSTLLMTAAADTGSRDVVPPELFNRFMAWTASAATNLMR